MTRTTEPTTKAEREPFRHYEMPDPIQRTMFYRLLDDADDLDALLRRVAELEYALKRISSLDQPGLDVRSQVELFHACTAKARGALSASPPSPPDPNADKVTCRRCGIKVDASECVGESADPDSEPVCYGCQFTLLIDERDRFQRLAKFYDAQIRENVAKTIAEHEPDGSPCWGGRAPTLHLIRVCDEHVKYAEIVRRLEEWNAKWTGERKQGSAPTIELIEIVRLLQIVIDAAALRAGAGGGA